MPAMFSTVRTTCPYCGVGCGVLVTPQDAEAATVKGDPEHPANFGRLCSKGSALGEILSRGTRLLTPRIGREKVSWDQALAEVARRFRAIIHEHGPEAVAFYGSGQLLTEDYYVANKLMKGYIGAANIDTNSRLCMSSTVAGQKRAFGEDVVPGCYEDLELADLVVLVGSNAAWCHPVLYQRLLKARQDNPRLRLVTIDPRRTATAETADLHLGIQPGTDALVFDGLLHYLRQQDRIDLAFLETHAAGYAEALAAAHERAPSIPATAAACGVPEEDLARFYHWFAHTEKSVTAWSQGINQSATVADKVNAILNVHLATGRIGKPGMGPLSLTGQPNAMGGREVGGLANQLAVHLELERVEHRALVQEFWGSPRMAERPGPKAVDLFQAIGEGRIRAVWIMGTNPVVSLPDSRQVRAALARCEFVVVSDCEADTDLAPFAHVSLPALAWGEKDGTVTNSERRLSRQRAFLPAPVEARPDWWILSQVARRLGFGAGFAYESAHEVFAEHARLSGYRNDGERQFDISGLAGLSQAEYDALPPMQWPVNARTPEGTARLFAGGRFTHADGRARLVSPRIDDLRAKLSTDYPLSLNTGRVRDQWHTMTRTGKSPRLAQHQPEPYAEIHPATAARFGILQDSLVRLETAYGEAIARARLTTGLPPESVFMPMHWSLRNATAGLVNSLVNPLTDPLSGEPESKHTPLRILPWQPAWQGFLLTRQALPLPALAYAVRALGRRHWRFELADDHPPPDWRTRAQNLLGYPAAAQADANRDEWTEFQESQSGRYCCAWLREERLMGCLFVDSAALPQSREWLGSLFRQERLEDRDRRSLLLGKPLSGQDPGRSVCACFGVGINTLRGAIQARGLDSVAAIGRESRAGTNCGSCIPELQTLLAERG
ncbi:MAG: molybdopterin-dependent oxidoreductase [Methylococcus sp.]